MITDESERMYTMNQFKVNNVMKHFLLNADMLNIKMKILGEEQYTKVRCPPPE